MDRDYRHLGAFSDWVRKAHEQRVLRPPVPPGPETRVRVRDALGFCDAEETPMEPCVEDRWERNGIAGEEVSWSVGYGPRTRGWVLKPAGADGPLPGVLALHGHDGVNLTGLPNRMRAEGRLAQEAARASRGGGLLTLGVVDVNRFKQINDAHGHQAGDACLRHVAGVMRRSVREGDWLARWAGDEFLLVLHDASAFAPTEAVLQRITEGLRRSPAVLPGGGELTLSVTVGAVRHPGGADPGADLEELFAKADEAMYRAKREGRAWVLAV